jgi:hypothetical protein
MTHERHRFFAFLIAAAAWLILALPTAAQGPAEDRADPEPFTRRPLDLAQPLTADQCRSDLAQFRRLIDRHWMLASATDSNFGAVCDAVQVKAEHGMTSEQLLLELQKVLALGIDGHAEMGLFNAIRNGQAIRGGIKDQEAGQLPFLMDLCGDHYVAYVHDRAPGKFINPKRKFRYRLLDDEFPYLIEIDGVPVEKWIDCARQFVPKGPQHAVRWRCVRLLQGLRFMRVQMGLTIADTVRITLSSEDLTRTRKLELPTAREYIEHRKKPHADWQLLEDNIGYISVQTGAEPGVRNIITGMPNLRETRGLVLDCRDNTGIGKADAVVTIGAYLLPRDTPRLIVGAIASPKGTGRDEETSVFLGMPGLSREDEDTIRSFQNGYKPEIELPADEYDWNYIMLVNPRATDARWGIWGMPEARKFFDSTYDYTQPVVVLVNHRVFSAGEMFVAGLDPLPNVTIVGTPTGASVVGSGLHTLPQSGLDVAWGSEAAFLRADGTLVDGRGLQPDVLLELDADYYRDTRDTALEKAVQIIRDQQRQ